MASAPAPARAAPTLPDEILEDIFLRFHEAADLARASAVCSSFRRAACGRAFLRRFRSLHPPPVLGVLDFRNPGVLLHAEPPHRSAPAARALAQAADFSFSFVPKPRDPKYSDRDWRVWDAVDGRVLLWNATFEDLGFLYGRYRNTAFEHLVVCDPLHRRFGGGGGGDARVGIPNDLQCAVQLQGCHPGLLFSHCKLAWCHFYQLPTRQIGS